MFLNKLAIKLIKQYQKKDRPHRCRHIPSCSNYGLECYQKFNFFKASFLTRYRILRCNPLSYKIYDPVPLTKSEKKEQKFEDAVRSLEKIISELESGEADLDSSIKKYIEAMQLIKFCEDKLDNATKTVNKLVDENGKITDFEIPE